LEISLEFGEFSLAIGVLSNQNEVGIGYFAWTAEVVLGKRISPNIWIFVHGYLDLFLGAA
jgi:hypothetical protein